MVERGKAWRNVLIASGITLASILPLKTNFGSKTPLEDRNPPIVQVAQLRAEKEKEDTVYLPQAVIDSAFGWKYGKVEEKSKEVAKAMEKAIERRELIVRTDELWTDFGDGWKVVVRGSGGAGVYYNNESVGGFSAGENAKEALEKLKSGELRFIKYTDEDGNNCLVVKQNKRTVNIFYAGIPGQGLIWIMDRNSPLTIGDIGFWSFIDPDYGKGLAIIANIKGDGLVGLAIFPDKKLMSDPTRIEVAKSK